MPRTGAAVSAAILAFAACTDPMFVVDGPITARRVTGGLELSNASSSPAHYFVVERGTAALIDFFPCAGPQCPAIPGGGMVVVPEADIHGFSTSAREAMVFWWRSVADGAGGFRADSVRSFIAPLK